MDINCNRCNRVSEILAAETEIIKQHLKAHQFYNHISDSRDAIADFVDKYAWIMREAFCACLCDERENCCVIPSFPTGPLPDISDEELQDLIKSCETDPELTSIELLIIKKHIRDHKWFNNITSYREAIEDFLRKFGWVIRELNYNNSIKNILKEMSDG